jgi:hypothetical protein
MGRAVRERAASLLDLLSSPNASSDEADALEQVQSLRMARLLQSFRFR